MQDEPITLARAFDVEKEVSDKASELKKSGVFQDIRQKMVEKAKALKLSPGFYDGLFDLLTKNLNELLAIDIPKNILAGTWKNQKLLWEYCDKEKYPPDVKSLVPLIEHTLKTSHEPSLEVSAFGQALGTLAVKLEATFLIKSGMLEVQDGKIKKIQTGDIESTGQLHYMNVPVMETKKIVIHIPGAYDLKEGVEITYPAGWKRDGAP
jgi:hypothetical protein